MTSENVVTGDQGWKYLFNAPKPKKRAKKVNETIAGIVEAIRSMGGIR